MLRYYLKQILTIRKDGNGNQGCYLASISNQLGELLLDLSRVDETKIQEVQETLEEAIAEDEVEKEIRQQTIQEVEKEQLVKARRGQGIFRSNLELIEKECRLTGVKDKRFLIASHIKAWKDSTNEEKLDGNNGLLLSPHVDKLFDRGWISFTDDGEILCANDEVKNTMRIWGLDIERRVGSFNRKQKEYLAFHRNKFNL